MCLFDWPRNTFSELKFLVWIHAWFEIRATAFKEQCDKYYNLCEVGKVYLINNCALKPANKQYSTLNNDYELTFRDSTEMQMVSDEDTSAIPSLSFEFVKISDLSANDKDKVSREGRNEIASCPENDSGSEWTIDGDENLCSSLNPLISKQRSSLYLQTVDIILLIESAILKMVDILLVIQATILEMVWVLV